MPVETESLRKYGKMEILKKFPTKSSRACTYNFHNKSNNVISFYT